MPASWLCVAYLMRCDWESVHEGQKWNAPNPRFPTGQFKGQTYYRVSQDALGFFVTAGNAWVMPWEGTSGKSQAGIKKALPSYLEDYFLWCMTYTTQNSKTKNPRLDLKPYIALLEPTNQTFQRWAAENREHICYQDPRPSLCTACFLNSTSTVQTPPTRRG